MSDPASLNMGPNKAIAAGAGSGLGGAVATIIMATVWKNADPAVASALTTLMTGAVAMAAAYLTPHGGKE